MTYDAVTQMRVFSAHRVIDTPHKNTEKRFVRTEQLNLLMFHSEVFLFELAKPAGHCRHTGHVSQAGACDAHLSDNTSAWHVRWGVARKVFIQPSSRDHRVQARLYTEKRSVARTPRDTERTPPWFISD